MAELSLFITGRTINLIYDCDNLLLACLPSFLAEKGSVEFSEFLDLLGEEVALEGGPEGLRRTIVSVRLNPRSPYLVDQDGEE